MEFKDILIMERKKNNLSQEKLAELLSVSRQSISKWENGDSYPEYPKLIALVEIFNCDLDYLCGRKDDNDTKENVVTVKNKKWVHVLVSCVMMIVGIAIGFIFNEIIQKNNTDDKFIEMPDTIAVDSVKFSKNSYGEVVLTFIPSVINEELTYAVSFHKYNGTESFEVEMVDGTFRCVADLQTSLYKDVALYIDNGTEKRAVPLVSEFSFDDVGFSWIPVE